MATSNCETCRNYCYDDEEEYYYCDMNLDEDEYLKFLSASYFECPYYENDDEYKIVRKQNWYQEIQLMLYFFFIYLHKLIRYDKIN